MKIINGLSDQPKQVQTITLADGSKAVFSLEYRAMQLGWFWDLVWAGASVALGQRLVASPNILRSFINTIPFGISVMTQGNVEPLNLEDLSDGTAEVVLLEGDDLALVETAAFGAPAGQTQAIATTPGGRPFVIPPSQWGPAGGDLGSTFPNPIVRAFHETGAGKQLTFGAVADGQFLKRSGDSVIGVAAGSGDVVGPAGAADGHLTLFDGPTGKLIKDGGNLSDGSLAFYLSVLKANRFSYTLQIDATAGAITLDLSSSNRFYIGMTAGVVLTFAGFANEFKGVIILKNTTGGALSIAWPACALSGDTLPTTIAAGQIYAIPYELIGSTLGTAVLYFKASTVVTSPLFVGGAINQRPAKNSAADNDWKYCGPDVFNVADYGAVPNTIANWAPNINAAITAAVAYIAAGGSKGCATVYFPKGLWYISSEILATLGQTGNIAIKGDSMHGSIIVAQTASQNGIYVDLSNGGADTFIKNRCTVSDLGFWIDDSAGPVQCGTAVLIDYGAAAFDQHFNGGSTVENLYFYNNNTNNGGWTYGLHLRNCWASIVRGIWGYGNSSGYLGASFPGAGDGGAGSGAFIVIEGGVNQNLSQLYAEYWSAGIQIIPLGGIGGAGLVPQGVQVSGYVVVEVIEPFHSFKNAGGSGADSINLTNWLFDNGNTGNSTIYQSIVLEGVNHFHTVNGDSRILGSNTPAAHVKMIDSSFCYFTACEFITGGGSVDSVTLSTVASGSKMNIFNSCFFHGRPINLAVACDSNQFNNIGSSAFNDSGAGNASLAGIF